MQAINSGDTAWVLASGALVLFMTPGLAIFYGGMVRAKSVLNMMMMSFSAIGVTTIIWVLYGYSLAFGKSHGGLIGGFENLGLAKTLDQVTGPEGHQIPVLAFAMFQLTFAVITVALLSGAIADRAKFGSWVLFTGVWITLVYLPSCTLGFCFTRRKRRMDRRQTACT
jgi:Amt family ammonium transporter